MPGYNSLKKMALKGVSILSNATTIIFMDLNQKYGFRSHLHISLDCCLETFFKIKLVSLKEVSYFVVISL